MFFLITIPLQLYFPSSQKQTERSKGQLSYVIHLKIRMTKAQKIYSILTHHFLRVAAKKRQLLRWNQLMPSTQTLPFLCISYCGVEHGDLRHLSWESHR